MPDVQDFIPVSKGYECYLAGVRDVLYIYLEQKRKAMWGKVFWAPRIVKYKKRICTI